MPAVPAPAKVLVTGASGFVAVWVVRTLLERGYTMIGTVRSKAKGEYLTTLFKDYDSKFSYVIVEDMEKEGAFDEAVRGVDAVEHTASPFHFDADDPQAIINPALKGTLGVLESIKNNGPNVKRVVITASVACITTDKGGLLEFDETDWNITSPENVKRLGKDASPGDKYSTSKVLAERAAWDFVKENKASIGFDLVTMCPPFIFGPIMQQVNSVASLNFSIASFREYTTNPKSNEELAFSIGNWADVRDVSLAHVLGLEKEEASGERFIISSGSFTYQDILDALHSTGEYPDVPKGEPGAGKGVKGSLYKVEKITRVLGMKFKTFEEMAPATLGALRDRGF